MPCSYMIALDQLQLHWLQQEYSNNCEQCLSHVDRKSYTLQRPLLGLAPFRTIRASWRELWVVAKNNVQQLICTSRPFRFVCCPHFLIGLPVASPIVTPVQCTAQPCLDQGIAKQRHAKSQVSNDQRHQGRALQRARNRAAEDTCRKPSGHT